MFTGISVPRLDSPSCRGLGTYDVLFKHVTCIDSPGLYPRASFKALIGCWPVTAAAREIQKELIATRGSQDRENILNNARIENSIVRVERKLLLHHFRDCRKKRFW